MEENQPIDRGHIDRETDAELDVPILMAGAPRDIFGEVSAEQLRTWLDRHVREHIGVAIDGVVFQGGYTGAVFGLRLVDGREVVVKVQRPDADLTRMHAVVAVQNRLAAAGFGCPSVLSGPASAEGVLVVIEKRLTCEPTGSPHQPRSRAAMAGGLATQIDAVRTMDGSALVAGRPAWADWDAGAWPRPHVPIFDFSAPVEGFEWVDQTADAAAAVLRSAHGLPLVIGHSDWVWQNVCVRDGRFVAGYDWDSLIYAPESAIVGLVAGIFTQGSPEPPDAPSAEQVAGFIEDYQAAQGSTFDHTERQIAGAAATWVRCYNARCELDNLHRRDLNPSPGSFIDQLRTDLGR